MGKKQKKTNAMRQLDSACIPYQVLEYHCDGENFDGCLVAQQVGLPTSQVFKTLVAKGERGQIAVCCIPVDKKLDLKALAAGAGCKSLEMVPVNEILSLTGYVRGGCSPVGMKKKYGTFIDSSALGLADIAVSAGARGLQLLLPAADLIAFTGAKPGDFGREQA